MAQSILSRFLKLSPLQVPSSYLHLLILLNLWYLMTTSMTVQVSSTPSTVNINATLITQITMTTNLDSNGLIRITSPTPTRFNLAPNLICSLIEPPTLSIRSCSTGSSSNIALVQVSGPVLANQTNPTRLFIQIGSFQNPLSTVMQTSFMIEIVSGDGNLVDSVSNGVVMYNLIPSVLNRVVFTPSSQVIGILNTNLSVVFALNNPIPTGGSLIVNLPFWNPQAPNPLPSVDQYLLQCFLNNMKVTCSLDTYSPTDIIITDPLLYTLTISQSQSLLIKGFKNPIQYQPMSGFGITTIDKYRGKIDSIQSLSIQVTSPLQIGTSQIQVESGSTIVQELSTIKLEFYSPIPLNSGTVIQVQFPNDFQKLYKFLTKIFGFGMFGQFQQIQYLYTQSNNTITIPNACSNYLDNLMLGSLRFSQFINPSTVRQVGGVTLLVKDSNGNLLSYQNTSLVFPSDYFKPGQFVVARLNISNKYVQENASLIIQLNPSHSLSILGSIAIRIPSTNFYWYFTSNCTFSNLSLNILSTKVNCSFQQAYGINITNPFALSGYNSSTNQSLQFSLKNILKNPISSLRNVGNFELQTFDVVDGQVGLVDSTVLENPFSIQGGDLGSLQYFVERNATNTGLYNINISFTTQHFIPQYGNVIIQLPVDITVDANALARGFCNFFSGFQTIPTCTYNSGTIIVSNGFNLSNSNAIQNISLGVRALLFPRSVSLLQENISIYTVDSALNIVDSAQITLNITVLQMQTCSIDISNKENGALSNLIVSFQFNQSVQSDDYIQLIVPSSIQFSNNQLLCYSNSIPVTCSYDGLQSVIISNNGSFSPLSNNFITISGIYNPSSTQPVNGFALNQNDDMGNVISQCQRQLTISTSAPQLFESIVMSQSNTLPNQPADYVFNILPNSNSYTFLIIRTPFCISVSLAANTFVDQMNKTLNTTMPNQNTFYIYGSDIEYVRIKNVKNPDQQCMATSLSQQNQSLSSFQISSYKDQNGQFIMEQSGSNLIPSLLCNFPCTTCLFTDKNYCTSCPSSQHVYKGTCVNSCPLMFYSLNTICSDCISNCNVCLNSTQCIECASPSSLFNGICLAKCPNRTFYLNQTCSYCNSSCATCANTTNTCTSCDVGLLLLNNTCVKQCPDGFHVSNFECFKQQAESVIKSALTTIVYKVYYYPILTIFGILSLITSLSLICLRHSTRYLQVILSFAAMCESVSYYYYAIVTIVSIKSTSNPYLLVGISGYSLVVTLLLNVIFFVQVIRNTSSAMREISPSIMTQFYDWRTKNRVEMVGISFILIVLSFHFIRFQDSMFLGIKTLNVSWIKEMPDLKTIYYKLGLINIFLRSLTIGANLYMYFGAVNNDRLKSTMLENTILSFIVMLTLLVLHCLQRRYEANQTKNSIDLLKRASLKKKSIASANLQSKGQCSSISYKSEETFQKHKFSIFSSGSRPRQSKGKISKLEDILDQESHSKGVEGESGTNQIENQIEENQIYHEESKVEDSNVTEQNVSQFAFELQNQTMQPQSNKFAINPEMCLGGKEEFDVTESSQHSMTQSEMNEWQVEKNSVNDITVQIERNKEKFSGTFNLQEEIKEDALSSQHKSSIQQKQESIVMESFYKNSNAFDIAAELDNIGHRKQTMIQNRQDNSLMPKKIRERSIIPPSLNKRKMLKEDS